MTIYNQENVEPASNVALPTNDGTADSEHAGEVGSFASFAPFIQLLASLYGSKLTMDYNQEADERQYYHQNQLIDKQYENDIKKWLMQTQYNSPEEFKKRLLAAGLNPNLITGIAGSTAAGQVGNSDVPAAYTRSKMEGVSQMISSMSNAVAQGTLLESQVEMNKSAAAKNLAEADAIPQDVETRKGHLRVAEGNLAINAGFLKLAMERNAVLNRLDEQAVNESVARINNLVYQNSELSARASLHEAESALKRAQSETWKSEASARIAELYSRCRLNKEHANLLAEQTITEFQTRAPRIAQILASTESDIKRAQLLQGEYDAMAEEIFKSQYWKNAAENGGIATDVVYAVERALGDLGKVWHAGTGSYTHTTNK